MVLIIYKLKFYFNKLNSGIHNLIYKIIMGKAIGKLFFKKGCEPISNVPQSFWSLSAENIDFQPV